MSFEPRSRRPLDWRSGGSLNRVDASQSGSVGTELASWRIVCGSRVEAQRLGPGGSTEYRRFGIDERDEADEWIRGYTDPEEKKT